MASTRTTLERLTDEQFETYRRKGYLALSSPFSDAEIARMQVEADKLFARAKTWDERNLRVQTRKDSRGAKVVDRLDPMTDLSDLFRSLSVDDRVLGAVRDVLQADARLVKDKLIFRPPEASGFKPHQDWTGWQETPGSPEAMLSVAIALDSCNQMNGALQFYPGMHHGHYGDVGTPKEYFGATTGLVPESCLAGCEPELVALEPGDVLVFGALAPHRTEANRSAKTRRILYLTYSDASYGDFYATFYKIFQGYLKRDRTAEGLANFYFE